MSKEINLTQGQVAVVDGWRFNELNQYKWYAYWNPHTNSFYARRNITRDDGKQATVLMHSVVSNVNIGMKTDHIDRNTLNNQESNLRVCTTAQNNINTKIRKDNTSGYKGVTYRKSDNRWVCKIQVNYKKVCRYFNSAEDAAKAYDKLAKELHGEFAVLNFPEE